MSRLAHLVAKSTPPPFPCSLGVEAVEVVYDASVVSFEDLVDLFFDIHSPVAVAGCGQYRSAIFTTLAAQATAARQAVHRTALAHAERGETIDTTVGPLEAWTEAGDHHQDYYSKFVSGIAGALAARTGSGESQANDASTGGDDA